MSRIKDKVVVIVGGSSGIGQESALLFAEQGATVILIARHAERLNNITAEIRAKGGKADAFFADVASRDQVNQAAEYVSAHYRRVDILMYSAGAFYLSPAEAMDIKMARQVMDVNYWGAIHVTQAFLPLIRHGTLKSIVFVSSLSVQCTPPYFTAYAATKHALRGFALSLRQELRPEGIHVAVVYPGPVDTPLIAGQLHEEMYPLPPGVPVSTPAAVATGILKTVLHHREETILPQRISLAARMFHVFPKLIERYYYLSIPGWRNRLLRQNSAQPGENPSTAPDSMVKTSELEE